MHWLDFAQELEPSLRKGDLDFCISRVTDVLQQMPKSPFHLVLKVDFTNQPVEVAAHFDKFAQGASDKINLATIATEANGFYINPDRWYFELFGYSSYGGHDNYDWLAHNGIRYEPTITLTGMERLQKVYTDEADTSGAARDYSDLLVVLRFQHLIFRSASYMQKVTVPVLATAHDYDFIYEVRPIDLQSDKA